VRDGAVPCLLCVVRVGCRPVAGGAAPRRRWAWSAHPSPRRRRPTWCRSGGTERSPATRSTVGHAEARHASQRMRQPVQVEKGTAAGVGGQPSCRRTPALGAVADSCGAAIGGLVRLAVSLPRRATAVVLVAGCSRAPLPGTRRGPSPNLQGSVLAVGAYRTARHRRSVDHAGRAVPRHGRLHLGRLLARVGRSCLAWRPVLLSVRSPERPLDRSPPRRAAGYAPRAKKYSLPSRSAQ
jgi:hypothetical protein